MLSCLVIVRFQHAPSLPLSVSAHGRLPRLGRGLHNGQSSISRRPSHFSSTAYKMLLPQLLCFHNDLFSWGVYPPQRGNHELSNDELQLHS